MPRKVPMQEELALDAVEGVEEKFDPRLRLTLDSEQCDAVYMLSACRVGVITGGPGRGKSWCLQAALPLLGRSVALCAPSGKAARRMSELTRHPASTVHKLLGLRPEIEGATYHRGNPLPFDVVVVDEASTLDVFLLRQLLDACDVERTRVFFVGDVDQLPSVGPGAVLSDLIGADAVPVVRLVTMHRSAAESWVCRMAPEILQGRIDLTNCDNFQFIEADGDLVEQTENAVSYLASKYGREAVQCIVPMNVGDYGTKVLNTALQEVINPHGQDVFSAGGARIRVGDDVVAIVNDYERVVFNGECGRITGVEDGTIMVDFYDRQVEYDSRGAGENLRLSYALTVHKMQGSEIPWVVLALHESHGPMLSRKLLYTAVTRARVGVVIVGQRSAVLRSVQLEDTTRRITTLRQRLEASS